MSIFLSYFFIVPLYWSWQKNSLYRGQDLWIFPSPRAYNLEGMSSKFFQVPRTFSKNRQNFSKSFFFLILRSGGNNVTFFQMNIFPDVTNVFILIKQIFPLITHSPFYPTWCYSLFSQLIIIFTSKALETQYKNIPDIPSAFLPIVEIETKCYFLYLYFVTLFLVLFSSLPFFLNFLFWNYSFFRTLFLVIFSAYTYSIDETLTSHCIRNTTSVFTAVLMRKCACLPSLFLFSSSSKFLVLTDSLSSIHPFTDPYKPPRTAH